MGKRNYGGGCSPDLSRRAFLRGGFEGLSALALMAATLPGMEQELTAQPPVAERKKVRNTIIVLLAGAMSQLDSFDPKPALSAEMQSPFKILTTKSGNALITEPFAALGKADNTYMLMRGMRSETSGSHQDAYRNWLRLPPTGTGEHILSVLTKGYTAGIPCVDAVTPGVETVFTPERKEISASGVSIVEIKWDEKKGECVSTTSFEKPEGHERRMGLRAKLENDSVGGPAAERFEEQIALADRLVRKGLTNAFCDSSPRIKAARTKLYGDNPYGKLFAMAGTMADPEKGNVRVTVIETGHWDHHWDIVGRMDAPGQMMSQALAGLIAEYGDRIVIAMRGEFGRYALDNGNAVDGKYGPPGRGHYPIHSGIIAGPGIKTGIYGATSKDGRDVAEGKVTNADFNQLLLEATGIRERTFENKVITGILKTA